MHLPKLNEMNKTAPRKKLYYYLHTKYHILKISAETQVEPQNCGIQTKYEQKQSNPRFIATV